MLKCKIGNYGSKCILKTVVMIESKKLNCVNCANKIKNKNNIDNSSKHMISYQSCRGDINNKARSASDNY